MKGKTFVIYSIVTNILEQIALVAIALWLLPKLGIDLPIWGLVLIMAAVASYSAWVTVLNKRALDRRPMLPPDIGTKGRARTPLSPTGYIRVVNEAWPAISTGRAVQPGEEVVVTGMEGMTLLVAPPDKGDREPDENRHAQVP